MIINLHHKKVSILLGLLLVVTVLVMQNFDKPLKNDVCLKGIVSFELAKNISKSKEIINSWSETDKINASLSLGFDFLFIVVYTLFITLMIYKINTKLWNGKSFYKIGSLLIYAIFIAGIFDVFENISLIKILNGNTSQVYATTAYYFASMKFAILLIGIIYLIGNWLYSFAKINH